MSDQKIFDIGARALGYYGLMASWRRSLVQKWEPTVCITAAASTDEGAHEPAQSVTINGREGLLALREVIDEALRDDDAKATGSTHV